MVYISNCAIVLWPARRQNRSHRVESGAELQSSEAASEDKNYLGASKDHLAAACLLDI